jgi:hypothetical protein
LEAYSIELKVEPWEKNKISPKEKGRSVRSKGDKFLNFEKYHVRDKKQKELLKRMIIKEVVNREENQA